MPYGRRRVFPASRSIYVPSLENNLFLVKRMIERTDMRNPDPSTRRYTSLAWAAILGHEETFDFLLNYGHDDEELSKVCSNAISNRKSAVLKICILC